MVQISKKQKIVIQRKRWVEQFCPPFFKNNYWLIVARALIEENANWENLIEVVFNAVISTVFEPLLIETSPSFEGIQHSIFLSNPNLVVSILVLETVIVVPLTLTSNAVFKLPEVVLEHKFAY